MSLRAGRILLSIISIVHWNGMKIIMVIKIKITNFTSWSFPPRPWTSHVRWIESDKNNPDYVFAAIEAGALVKSHDGGRTWKLYWTYLSDL